ncbi:ketoacyl-ACP synthase III [Deinococcus sp. KSM4-11]|uniref:ketoacyl-ACP synthase III n=1 Tax=Deinococcus sp. KSM4-11 TaxID=2568654 RepID=UPI0010A49635|nr:ketoacyl-ACP synthase III [Deinococcus sp. KSM4-11]THF85591.1 ketoacyl-ACP synthase III [Deinococcus sp. KSM4-11]
MIRARIHAVSVHLPTHVETNDDLHAQHPDWNVPEAARHTGVEQRHISAPGETALDLAEQAVLKLFTQHPQAREAVDTIIFCTQTPDHRLPPNACVLHGRLGLPRTVAAFDVNLACSGFTYSLTVAAGLIHAGSSRHVLIVNADTYTKLISPDDRSTRLLFGDGAAVTWLGPGDESSFILGSAWGTDGTLNGAFCVPGGAARLPTPPEPLPAEQDGPNRRTRDHIYMNGKTMLSFTYQMVPPHIHALLSAHDTQPDDVKQYLFHQASNMVLDGLRARLHLTDDRFPRHLAQVGNTVSASIPLLLHEQVALGRVRRGDLLCFSGFGSGLSWASVLLRY